MVARKHRKVTREMNGTEAREEVRLYQGKTPSSRAAGPKSAPSAVPDIHRARNSFATAAQSGKQYGNRRNVDRFALASAKRSRVSRGALSPVEGPDGNPSAI
jgi:hypothetical protein